MDPDEAPKQKACYAICLMLTFALGRWACSLEVCSCVEWAWPAWGLTPLRLVEALRTCYTTAHVALPIISGLAGNWKKMAFNMGLPPSSTTHSLLWQDELLRDRVYHSGLKNVHSRIIWIIWLKVCGSQGTGKRWPLIWGFHLRVLTAAQLQQDALLQHRVYQGVLKMLAV